jgi:hypothetical protein
MATAETAAAAADQHYQQEEEDRIQRRSGYKENRGKLKWPWKFTGPVFRRIGYLEERPSRNAEYCVPYWPTGVITLAVTCLLATLYLSPSLRGKYLNLR